MFSDRIKTILCLVLAKTLQPCLASRRFDWGTERSSTFVRFGRIDCNSRRQTTRDDDHDDLLLLPDSFMTVSDSATSSLLKEVRHVSTKTKKIRKKKKRRTTVKEEEEQPIMVERPKMSDELLSIKVSDPIIADDVWEQMTGNEFENPATVDRLARSGLEMAIKVANKNDWIQWTAHKDTEKLLKEKDEKSALEDGDVLMYVGKVKRQEGFFGANLPIIKSKSILPLSAKDMAELLMDSSRVKTYNKLSVGRKDVRILTSSSSSSSGEGNNKCSKIVCNLTKPPIAKSKMVSITLMHARPLGESDRDVLGDDEHKDGYLVVSRAVPGMIDEELAHLPRNDILLGVNVLQDIGPDRCMMTAVTHVYSPALPTMLAKKMGVSSAINFVRDIRDVCIPVAK